MLKLNSQYVILVGSQHQTYFMDSSSSIKIISGGQTGADQAALDAAISLGLPHGGWITKGRKTETGPLPEKYHLQELASERYRDRTEKNVLVSDGTLIFSFGPMTGGTALTEALTIRHNRPCLCLNLDVITTAKAVSAMQTWLQEHQIQILNVAGPRASGEPRIHEAVYTILAAFPWEKVTV
jgi:hypothetical protein